MLIGTLATSALASAQDSLSDSAAFQTVAYDGVPIDIELQAGVQSMLRFPWQATVGLSAELVGVLEPVTIGDTTFLTPQMEFDSVEVKFKNAANGTIIVTRISSSESAMPVMLNIEDIRGDLANARSRRTGDQLAPQENERSATQRGLAADYSYIGMSRFAFQQMYSPVRLQEPLPGMRPRRLKGSVESRADYDLFPGERVVAVPWAEWRAPGGLYVTAVYLENRSERTVRIDPRRLRYDQRVWKGLSFYAGHMGPASGAERVTTMVVISTTSWRRAMAIFRPGS